MPPANSAEPAQPVESTPLAVGITWSVPPIPVGPARSVVMSPEASLPAPNDSGLAALRTELEQVEQILARELDSYQQRFPELIRHLQAYRGKRLRPALLLLMAQACGRLGPEHFTLAAVVEMIHTATLIHDDVLDEAALRRHRPTVHAVCGSKAAILLGDLLFTHAFHLAATVDQQACRLIGQATNRVCAGELQQWSERGNWQLSEADYWAIIDAKTAALTECAAQLGAWYAGASSVQVQQAALYGRYLGLAYQVYDDLLDLNAREDDTGKTLGTDVLQGKATLPLIHALQHLTGGSRDHLQQLLKTPSRKTRRQLLSLLERSGSLAYARQRAMALIAAAQDALEAFPPSPAREQLHRLTLWSLQRSC
ncbi:MAG: polyprenyl synthetase family protein [Gemmataceae bacterium]|nr:polyprenyl synthetase family protein [Gemmataceae bacterium]MDW8243323.1 polyprenyl synthetase family protein [Thermogemmata sp.]